MNLIEFAVFAAIVDWHPIVQVILQGLAPLFVAAVTALFTVLTHKINEHVKSQKTQDAVNRLMGTALLAVTEVGQTTIDAARKAAGEGNSLPKDVAEAAKTAALAKVKSYMSPADANWLVKAFGLDTPEKLQAFIESHVEQAVAHTKP